MFLLQEMEEPLGKGRGRRFPDAPAANKCIRSRALARARLCKLPLRFLSPSRNFRFFLVLLDRNYASLSSLRCNTTSFRCLTDDKQFLHLFRRLMPLRISDRQSKVNALLLNSHEPIHFLINVS